MKIRKFTAPSVPLALQQVRDVLGDRAVILNTRKLPAGGDPDARVEVTAAHDGAAAPAAVADGPVSCEAHGEVRRQTAAAVASVAAGSGAGADLLGRVYGRSRPGFEPSPSSAPRPAARRWQEGREADGVEERHIRSAAEWLASLPSVAREGAPAPGPRFVDPEREAEREAEREMQRETQRESRPAGPAAAAEVAPAASAPSDAVVVSQLRQLEEAVHRMARQTSGFELPPELARLGERLRRTGLAESHVRACLQAVLRELDDDAAGDVAAVAAAAVRHLSARLPQRRDIRVGKARKVVALVGASGAGKTTAAVRIAAGFARRQAQRRGADAAPATLLLSADTRRVGAQAQIHAFSELIGVPLVPAYDAGDVRAATDAHPGARLLLLDTGGCGPHERDRLDAQSQWLAEVGVDEIHVVVDGLTGYDHIVEMARAWSAAAGQETTVRLLVTKMDQGVRPGVVVSAAIDAGLPLSYLTVSADVPGGIRPGDLSSWVEWMAGLAPRPDTEPGTEAGTGAGAKAGPGTGA